MRHYCAGANCPGLAYRASDLAHPPSCRGDKPRVDYRDVLRQRAAELPEQPRALTTLQHKQRRDLEAWRARWAEYHRDRGAA